MTMAAREVRVAVVAAGDVAMRGVMAVVARVVAEVEALLWKWIQRSERRGLSQPIVAA